MLGNGDSTLIKTPNNKTILIDTGDGRNDILYKYLLDRRIKKLDYIIISHFDEDHCNGAIKILEKFKIENIIISKQPSSSEELKNFFNALEGKRINLIVVDQGDEIYVENNVKLDILYPEKKLKYDDLNNNSLVVGVDYYKCYMIFTGDIDYKVENDLINSKKQVIKEKLEKTNILKVSHHGSKNSTSNEFIEYLKPSIALIGVGNGNKFNHPSDEVIERLNNKKIQIYRTDKLGEVVININKKGRIRINTKIKTF